MGGFYDHELSYGITAFIDFAAVLGCDQFVVGPTHARGGTLDLLMTDVLTYCVLHAVIAPIGNSGSLLSDGGHFGNSGCSTLVCL